MNKPVVKVVNKSSNDLPKYETVQSAGMDLRAFIEEDIYLEPMERKIIPTGIYMALEAGYEAQVRPRSGLAAKKGITVLNAPGTVDADYRGEVGVILINLSNERFQISNGDRIAQLVIAPYVQTEWVSTDELDSTERGSGGFGSTGA